jgi:hypothetical protein
MNGLPKLAALLMLCVMVAGCQLRKTPTIATTPNAELRPPVCTVWKAISYSAKSDSAETVREVREINAARVAYCK